MDKANPNNLPALYNRASIEDFYEKCERRQHLKNYAYEGDEFGKKRNIYDHYNANEYVSSFEFHREAQGFSREEMAYNLGRPLKNYIDFEDGEDEPSGDFYIAFAQFMDIHIADLIVETERAMNPALLNIILYQYERYMEYGEQNDFDLITKQKIDVIIDAIKEEGSSEFSYNRLIDEVHSCKEVIENKDQPYSEVDIYSYSWLSCFITRLLVNDGNGNYLPSDLIAIEKERVETAYKGSHARLEKSSNRLKINTEQLDDLGLALFGKAWKNHCRILDTVSKEFDRENFQDFFFHDLPWDDKKHSEDKKSELLGLFKSKKINLNLAAQDAQQFTREKTIKECLGEFLDSYGEALKIYDNRQMIMQRAPDLISDYHGEPEHPHYMRPVISWDPKKLKQKPAGLLPKP